ncbi:hypothetical protein Drorol1_Dr00003539 [Drosera rotundifolia]
MGFSMVYRSLVELFPQVDIRILKAVAIECPKDVEGAVEIILTEVVPYVRQNDARSVSSAKTETASIQVIAETSGSTGNDNCQPGNIKDQGLMPCASSTTPPVEDHAVDLGKSTEHALLDQMSDSVGSLSQKVDQGSNKMAEGASETAAELQESSDENIGETRSTQACGMDSIEEIVEDAKSNKKILNSEMQSVVQMIREVELQEKALSEVKEMAANGGSEILAEVEEIRKIIFHAKEENDMHAGEVNGEKAILTTEMKELQARLLCMSEERDESLSILNKMQQALQERLNSVQEEIRAAEKQKLEKEESARVLLAKEKEIMEKVVEESKILQQEAEENAKLHDFLMDRGRTVDTLQGELSVICQDVKLLKERFDSGTPLSESLTLNNQISSFVASSRSASSTNSALDQIIVPTEPSIMSEHDTTTVMSQQYAEKAPLSDTVLVNNIEEAAAASIKGWMDDNWEPEPLSDTLVVLKDLEEIAAATGNSYSQIDDDWEFFDGSA